VALLVICPPVPPGRPPIQAITVLVQADNTHQTPSFFLVIVGENRDNPWIPELGAQIGSVFSRHFGRLLIVKHFISDEESYA
jgi:hypothetical protein